MLIRSVSRIEAKCNFVIRFSTNSEKVFREATISLLKKISPEFCEEDLEYALTGKTYWMCWHPKQDKKYECRICSNKVVELSATAISLFASYSIATALAKGNTEFKRGFANYADEIWAVSTRSPKPRSFIRAFPNPNRLNVMPPSFGLTTITRICESTPK